MLSFWWWLLHTVTRRGSILAHVCIGPSRFLCSVHPQNNADVLIPPTGMMNWKSRCGASTKVMVVARNGHLPIFVKVDDLQGSIKLTPLRRHVVHLEGPQPFGSEKIGYFVQLAKWLSAKIRKQISFNIILELSKNYSRSSEIHFNMRTKSSHSWVVFFSWSRTAMLLSKVLFWHLYWRHLSEGIFPSSFPVLTYSNHVRHLAPGVSSFHLVAEARVGFLRKFWSKTCPACGWLFHLGVWTLGLIVSHLLVARAPRRDSRSSTKTKQHVGKPNENVVLGGWNHDGHEMKWNFSKVLNQICSYEGLNPNWFPEFFFGEIFDLMRDQIDISCLISPLLYFHNYMAALDIPLKQHGLSPTKAFWDSVPNHPVKRWPSDLDILQVSKKMILLGPTFQMDPDI